MYASKVFFAESKENDENNQAYMYSYYYFMAERRYVLTIINLFCVKLQVYMTSTALVTL